MKTTKLGFYKIQGADGHIYDSMFNAVDGEAAEAAIKESARRIRSSGEKLTGKAKYFITRLSVPPKRIRWRFLEV